MLIRYSYGVKRFNILKDADDTVLFLDGSTASFQNAINILNYFGNCSGLRINVQKTKAIWIGASKDNNELKLERSDVGFVCNVFV